MTTGASIYLVSACSSGEEFVAAFRRYADRTGLFIPVSDPLPAGRRGRVALTLKDGGVMVEGEAEVIASSPKASALHGRIGMTIRFVEPDEPSKIVLGELEKARLAMKPAPPSVPPRPSEIPPAPRPVPPAPGGRIDANNALAECVMIGDATELREGGGSRAATVTAAPPKASQRFVVPTIPQVGGAARPRPPSTPPDPRAQRAAKAESSDHGVASPSVAPELPALAGRATDAAPGARATKLGMSPIKTAVPTSSTTPTSSEPHAKNPAPAATEISIARTTTVPGIAPADPPLIVGRNASAPVPSGTVPGVAPGDRAAPAAIPPALATTAPPATPVPLTTVPGTAAPARKAPPAVAAPPSEADAYAASGHGRGPRMTMMGPAVAASRDEELVTPSASAPPAAPTLPTGPRAAPAAMGRSKSATAPPRFPTPVAPLPVTRLPAQPTAGKSGVMPIADVDLAEPTDLNEVPGPPGDHDALTPPAPRPSLFGRVSTERSITTSTRASQILAAIPSGGDWTMTPEASVPTVLSGRDGAGPKSRRHAGPPGEDDQEPAMARASSGDWTISLTSDGDAAWGEPQKADTSVPAQRKPHPANTPTSGNPVFAVSSDQPLSSDAPEERPTAIEPKVEIDPSLMDTPLPLGPPPLRVATSGMNIPPPLAPMPMPRHVPMELRSQTGQSFMYTTPLPGAVQNPAALQQLGSQMPMTTFPPPPAAAGLFGRDSGGMPLYEGDPTIAADPARKRTRAILIVGGAVFLIAVAIALIVIVGAGNRRGSSRMEGSGTAAATVPAGPGSGDVHAGSGSGSQQVAIAEPPHTETTAPDAGVAAVTGTCTVEVTSVPPGAEVALDNTKDHVLGITPNTFELPCDTDTKLYIRKAKYLSVVKAVTATAETAKVPVIKLSRPSFALKVTSSPPGATITVGGRSLGVTPTTVKLPAFDATAITVTKDGFTPDTQRIAVKTNNGSHHVVLKKLGAPKKPH